jgi:hypothetical protein
MLNIHLPKVSIDFFTIISKANMPLSMKLSITPKRIIDSGIFALDIIVKKSIDTLGK